MKRKQVNSKERPIRKQIPAGRFLLSVACGQRQMPQIQSREKVQKSKEKPALSAEKAGFYGAAGRIRIARSNFPAQFPAPFSPLFQRFYGIAWCFLPSAWNRLKGKIKGNFYPRLPGFLSVNFSPLAAGLCGRSVLPKGRPWFLGRLSQWRPSAGLL